jgi:hypothetical protein
MGWALAVTQCWDFIVVHSPDGSFAAAILFHFSTLNLWHLQLLH